jgi:hypothetical protein
MNSKKGIFFIGAVLLIPVLLCACKARVELPRWSFGVEGAQIQVFSSFDYAKLDEANITVERPQADGSIATEELRGVYLKDVLDYLDVSEYSSITLTSRNGSTALYLPEIIEDPDTLLVFEVNGRTQWENGVEIVQVVAGGRSEDMWLWNIKTLTVNP